MLMVFMFKFECIMLWYKQLVCLYSTWTGYIPTAQQPLAATALGAGNHTRH